MSAHVDYTDRSKIREKAKQIAPISDEEIERLILLLDGMKDSTSDLNELMQGFEDSIDVSLLSSTVEGGKL